ncbi:hypothetical protein AB1Y20_000439 [Prymnesium parvum]|uniref:RING-type domain-containing protein n=1 Tax=Prymnesium parvum TaxID=97485 RepID=A0AB34K8B0_PRYPA|mmetsp:Transcript_15422/g.37038  ORF Transcript_15422/g.37038 Transcript_15422/m.37038 type:complete len:322 (-) Transcript_15422:520-1485(-)
MEQRDDQLAAAPTPVPTQDAEVDEYQPPRATPMQEFIALYPLPYAIVSARMLLVSSAVVLCLVVHNVVILVSVFEDDKSQSLNPVLRFAALARVIAAIPRPILWWRIYVLYTAAMREPTTLRVAQRLIAAHRDRRIRCNAALNNVYNVWLLGVITTLAYRYLQRADDERTLFERALCRHACWCVLFMVTSHLVSVVAMLSKIHSGEEEQALHARQLERCSECIEVDEAMQQRLADDPCIICFATFEEKQIVRKLPRCGHLFHKHCADAWLLKHGRGRMACPICSSEIGVELDVEEEKDPQVSRELAWLAEVRRLHPGIDFW